MFLTTGLATLSALWILIYVFLLTLIRFTFLSTPPEPQAGGWEAIKRFIYRSTRLWLFVLTILLGAVLLDVIVKGAQYRSGEHLTGINGIGPGIAGMFSFSSPHTPSSLFPRSNLALGPILTDAITF